MMKAKEKNTTFYWQKQLEMSPKYTDAPPASWFE